jgi:hypothetical protein
MFMVENKIERVGYVNGVEAIFRLTPNQFKKWKKNPVVRSRPVEHLRSGVITSKGYRSPTTVNAGLTISQVGARPLTHRNHTYYEVGGGLFTRRQVLESRRRFAEVKYNMKVSKKQVGL